MRRLEPALKPGASRHFLVGHPAVGGRDHKPMQRAEGLDWRGCHAEDTSTRTNNLRIDGHPPCLIPAFLPPLVVIRKVDH